MTAKQFDDWLSTILSWLEDLHDELEELFYSYRCCCCLDPEASSTGGVGSAEDKAPSSWTTEEREAVDNLSFYLEKRLPLLRDDCPEDLKAHLSASVSREHVRALNLLSTSNRVIHRQQGAANLVTLARMMLVKGTGISQPDLCVPTVRLLETLDPGVQSGVAMAVAIFSDGAIPSNVRSVNLRQLREGGVLAALLPLLTARSPMVQVQAAAAITALTSIPTTASGRGAGADDDHPSTRDAAEAAAAEENALVQNYLLTLGVTPSLLQLLRPPHVEDAVLTNNVVGSLLNLSHFPNGRSSLVLAGGVPVLVNSLRYLIEEAVPRGGLFSPASSQRSSDRSSSSSSTDKKTKVIGEKNDDDHRSSGDGSGDNRNHGGRRDNNNVVEDLSLFYALATLTNLCESRVYRTMIIGVGAFDVVGHLIDIIDCLSTTSDDAVAQACVLLRNLAIEVDHRLLLVKCGVVPAAEGLFEALLLRTDKRMAVTGARAAEEKILSSSGNLVSSEEKILTAALEFLENLALHRHCRAALMSEKKIPELLFRVVGCRYFSESTRKNAIRLLASVCQEEASAESHPGQSQHPQLLQQPQQPQQPPSLSSSDVKANFLRGIYACALEALSSTAPTGDAVLLDLLALLVSFLGSLGEERRRKILAEDPDHAAVLAEVGKKLALCEDPGSAEDFKRFLEESAAH